MTNRIDDEDDQGEYDDYDEHDEQCDAQDPSSYYYTIDGHEVSGWIYNEDYDEPRRGDYDHAEECS
jgi:hypothetical protein